MSLAASELIMLCAPVAAGELCWAGIVAGDPRDEYVNAGGKVVVVVFWLGLANCNFKLATSICNIQEDMRGKKRAC